MSKEFWFFLTAFIQILNFNLYLSQSVDCSLNKTYLNRHYFKLKQFNSFDQFNFQGCQIDFNVSNLVNGVTFRPNQDLILNNSLNFSGLILQVFPLEEFDFVFYYLNGFESNFNSFKNVIKNEVNIIQLIYFSKLRLYHQNRLISVNECNETILLNNKINIFQNVYSLEFFSTVFYGENVCPLLFANSKSAIKFEGISESFINKNVLTFYRLKSTSKIPNHITILKLIMFHVSLDNRLLSDQLFYNLQYLELCGQVNSMKDDLFKNFPRLLGVKIKSENIRNIFQRSNKWLKYLNHKLTVSSFYLLVYETTPLDYYLYTYPNEDICYFKDFPHNHFVFPILKPQNKTNCSCTKIFLTQYTKRNEKSITIEYTRFVYGFYQFYRDDFPSYHSSDYFMFLNKQYNLECTKDFLSEKIKSCEFERRFNKCDIKTYENKFYFYTSDWKHLDGKIEFIITVLLIPVFSIVSILINVLTVIILSDKSVDLKLYKYLKISCYFNIFYLVLTSFKLISYCRSSYYKLFCSKYYSYLETAYFAIIGVRVLGNAAKASSNLSITMFTLSRYIFVSNRSKSKFNYLIKLKPIFFVVLIFLFSLSLNVPFYLQFSNISQFYNAKIQGIFEIPNGFYDVNEYTIDSRDSFFSILYYFNVFRILVLDVFVILINIILDTLLFLYVKRKKNKKEILNSTIQSVVFNRIKLAKKKKQEKASLHRITGLIVLNGVNFLVFRFPSLLISFYPYVFFHAGYTTGSFTFDLINFFCVNLKFCFLAEELSTFLFLVSFLLQFFILFKTDINFSTSCKKIFNYFDLKKKNKTDI